MAGVPMVMRAMLEAIAPELPHGIPVTAVTVSAANSRRRHRRRPGRHPERPSRRLDRLLSFLQRQRSGGAAGGARPRCRGRWNARHAAHRSHGAGKGRHAKARLVQLELAGFGFQRRHHILVIGEGLARRGQRVLGVGRAGPAPYRRGSAAASRAASLGLSFSRAASPATIALGSGAPPPPFCAVSKAMRSTSVWCSGELAGTSASRFCHMRQRPRLVAMLRLRLAEEIVRRRILADRASGRP